jgi:hypothetical protein
MSPSEAYLKAKKAEKSQARGAEKPVDINPHLKTRRLRGSPDAILKASQAADAAVRDFYHTLELTLKSRDTITVEVQRIGASQLLRATTQPYLDFSIANIERTGDERNTPEVVEEGNAVIESLLTEKGQVLKQIICTAVVSLRLVMHTVDECEDMNTALIDHYEANPDELKALATQLGIDEDTAIATQKVYSIDLFDELGLITFYEQLFGLTIPGSEVEQVDAFRGNGTGEPDTSESVGTGNEPPESDVSIDAPAV